LKLVIVGRKMGSSCYGSTKSRSPDSEWAIVLRNVSLMNVGVLRGREDLRRQTSEPALEASVRTAFLVGKGQHHHRSDQTDYTLTRRAKRVNLMHSNMVNARWTYS
jgi:hypothetical protein